MAKAKEAARVQRLAMWKNLNAENPIWGPPVTDSGYNKKTLFKEMAPRYSKLFASTTDKQGSNKSPIIFIYVLLLRRLSFILILFFPLLAGTGTVRQERQAKSQAMAKIQDTMQGEWSEQDFSSLRKSRQKDTRTQEQSEGREQGSAWTSKKTDASLEGSEDFSEDVIPSGSNEKWQSNRIEQVCVPFSFIPFQL